MGLSIVDSRLDARLIVCWRHQTAESVRLSGVLATAGDENAFNPSVSVHDGTEHLVFRAFGPGRTKPFHAVHLQRLSGDEEWTRTDLTEHAQAYGIAPVADPKLVELQGDLYVTFNTGYSATRNELYLMRLAPQLGTPQRCSFEGRQAVEKNWGFFDHPSGVAALYSLDPLRILHLESGGLGEGHLRFTLASGTPDGRPPTTLTIGTQPVVCGDELLLIAHQKVRLLGRRGYLGRPVAVTPESGAEMRLGRTRLVHSIRSSLPHRPAHNPNLLFATYFSGMRIAGDRAVLGYGINDMRYGFAEMAVTKLWQ